jgi:hypothetical protein
MNLNDALKLAAAVITSFGGAGLIVVGLSNWLGKVWANRLMTREQARFNADLERLKNQYSKELEEYRSKANLSLTRIERYDVRRFEIGCG